MQVRGNTCTDAVQVRGNTCTDAVQVRGNTCTDAVRLRGTTFVPMPFRSPNLLYTTLTAIALASVSSAPQLVSFPTQDGGIVYADLYGKGDRAVVLAHGGPFNKGSWEKQARVLEQAGFRVLAIDFRGRGQSRGGTQLSPGDDGYHFDVLAAVRYLRRNGAKTVSVVGASFGGGAAAEASIEAPGQIERLVMLAASTDTPEKLQGRKLFIVARDDANADGLRLPGIRACYEKAPGPKDLIVLNGSAHAQYLFQTDQGDQVMREILKFLTAP